MTGPLPGAGQQTPDGRSPYPTAADAPAADGAAPGGSAAGGRPAVRGSAAVRTARDGQAPGGAAAGAPAAGRPRHGFTRTAALARLALRRDRVLLPAWILVFVVTAAGSVSATSGVYPSAEDRIRAANSLNDTAALVALYGRIYQPTLGALAMIKLGGLFAALVGVLAIVVVIRHTRAEEESGRLELVGSTVVGRYAPLTAALLVMTAASVVLGLLTAVALVGAGLPAAGSFAFGLGWAAVGITFAAVAAVTAQLTTSGRAAIGLATATLGLTYLLRAVGDTAGPSGPRWLHWLSPIGWAQQVRPFAGERWWVLLLPVVFSAVLAAGAYALVTRRDLGAGLLPDRLGPATAAPSLRSPLALAWRLHRATLAGWAASFAVLGGVFGSIAGNLGGLLDSPQARDLITKLGGEKGLTDAFLATELGFVGLATAAYGVQATLRLRGEETAQRAEPVLVTAVSRLRWAAGHLVIAFGGAAVLLACAGLAAGALRAVDTGDAGQLGQLVGAALVQLPAVAVVIGIVVAAFGLVPRAAAAGWVALVAFLLLGEFGPILRLSQAAMDLSPFAHLPKVPGVPVTATPLLWLLAAAAALTATGLAAFRRRDIG
jgi:ABC-2 type transport system permease protein